jgi:hypothetical protein
MGIARCRIGVRSHWSRTALLALALVSTASQSWSALVVLVVVPLATRRGFNRERKPGNCPWWPVATAALLVTIGCLMVTSRAHADVVLEYAGGMTATYEEATNQIAAAVAAAEKKFTPAVRILGDIPLDANITIFNKLISQQFGTVVFSYSIGYNDPFKGDPIIATPSPLGNRQTNSIFGSGFAFSVNGADLLSVGSSETGTNGPYHAFEYSLNANTTTDLGTLAGPNGASFAYGISVDASTVIGASYTTTSLNGPLHAFRIGSDGVMTDLGSLAGVTGNSTALAVDDNGGVVVGWTQIPSGAQQAFSWAVRPGADTGVMTALPGIGGVATVVSGDGSVVVGGVPVNGLFNIPGVGLTNTSEMHAGMWTRGGAPTDLGVLSGHLQSIATGVSSDGSIVVGISDPIGVSAPTGVSGYGYGSGAQAFRWTQATSIQNLNTLLSKAGVNMSGINLLTAETVSPDGQFIGGAGTFPDTPTGSTTSYTVRYCDTADAAACAAMPMSPPGMTTSQSQQDSVTGVGQARQRVMVQEQALVAGMLGENQSVITPQNRVGVFASGGSATAGAYGRFVLGNGFTLLAGAGYEEEAYHDVTLNSSGFGAVALRYVAPPLAGLWGAARPYGEVGGWGAPNTSLTFARTYVNGAGTATGQGTTNAALGYAYGRAGMVFTPTANDELAPALELGNEWLSTEPYAEPLTPGNPFNAAAAGAIDSMLIGKLRVAWTRQFTPHLDATVWAAGAHAFTESDSLVLSVAGIGTFSPISLGRPNWAEFGARVGYKLTERVAVELFMDGVSGGGSVGTNLHGGADIRVTF